MTHTEADAPRKPRWLGLWLPWAIAAALAIGWSLVWLWLRSETLRQIDAAAASIRARGGQASWSALRFGGYPFRLDVDATDLRLADPSGWSVSLPLLKGEAYAFAPTRWILATDAGLSFTRPGEAPVRIASPLLRVSLNSWDQHPPRLSFVGDDLAFAGPPGVFPLASARVLQIYTRAGPTDQGAALIELDGGRAAPGTDLAKLAGAGAVTLTVEAVLSHASALSGAGWRAAAAGWSRGGGEFSLQRLTFAAGSVSLEAHAGSLTLGDDGRLAGGVDARLSEAGRTTPVRLLFQQDGVWLGRARIGPSPRAY